MKILYFVPKYPRKKITFIHHEIVELARRGHEIIVFSRQQPDTEIDRPELSKLDISIYYETKPGLMTALGLVSRKIFNRTVLREAAYVDAPVEHIYRLYLAKQIIDVFESEPGIDLLHAHFADSTRIGAAYAAAYESVPCSVTAHAYEIFKYENRSTAKRVLDKFDHIVTPSKYNCNYLKTELDVEKPISVVPATIRVDDFAPSPDSVSGRILTVANLVEKKGHTFAIEAVNTLLQNGYDISYHIVGSGSEEARLRRQVDRLGINDSVTFLGKVSEDKLRTEFADAEIFLLPCIIDSNGDRDVVPVVLKEAMATQTPCVSTNLSGIPELIIDGENGVLVEPNNSPQLAAAVESLLNNPDQRREMAKKGRETVTNEFDISKAVDNLEGVFSKLV